MAVTPELMDELNAQALDLGVSPPWRAVYGPRGVEIQVDHQRATAFIEKLYSPNT